MELSGLPDYLGGKEAVVYEPSIGNVIQDDIGSYWFACYSNNEGYTVAYDMIKAERLKIDESNGIIQTCFKTISRSTSFHFSKFKFRIPLVNFYFRMISI